MLDRIQIDPTVCEGRPTIRGLRITVERPESFSGVATPPRTSSAGTPSWKRRTSTRPRALASGSPWSGRRPSDEVAG